MFLFLEFGNRLNTIWRVKSSKKFIYTIEIKILRQSDYPVTERNRGDSGAQTHHAAVEDEKAGHPASRQVMPK